MPTASLWKTRPIFITSTFRDMHAERDYLRNHVFPVLEERLRERRHRLEPIDLRWGIDTVSIDDEHAKELLVLKVCLGEIERSRPFQIVLLGDRYGWIPPQERMMAAAQEAGFAIDCKGKSITALEIEFGIHAIPGQQHRIHFYLRDPLPYSQMEPEQAALYNDEYNPSTGSRGAFERLQKLKTQIENDPELKNRVHHYHAEWDPQEKQVRGLEIWGKQVLEDVWKDLAVTTNDWLNAPIQSWQDQERFNLEEFVESHIRHFIGRQQICQDLCNWALCDVTDHQIICIHGSSGSGKSTLFSETYHLLSQQECLILANSAGISLRAGEVDSLLRRWCEELALFLGDEAKVAADSKIDEIINQFHTLLYMCAQKKRVILLLDALNQFEPIPRSQYLTWLPQKLPTNVRMLATTLPGTQLDSMQARKDCRLIPLPSLHELEAGEIISAICHHYHRSLPKSVVNLLLSKHHQDGTLAAGNPLWLQIAVEELNLLDEKDFKHADMEFVGTSGERTERLLYNMAEEFPVEVADLYDWMLNRIEEIFGIFFVRFVLSLIALSRQGWRESDLAAIWESETETNWPAALFSGLRRHLRNHLVQCSSLGQWNFYHQQLRQAVERRYFSYNSQRKEQHSWLAKHLGKLSGDDPLRLQERIVHLIHADDKENIALIFSVMNENISEQELATNALVEYIISAGTDESQNRIEWICELPQQSFLSSKQKYIICANFIHFFSIAFDQKGLLFFKKVLLEWIITFLQSLDIEPSLKKYVTREITVCLDILGRIAIDEGDLVQAENFFEKAIHLLRPLFDEQPIEVEICHDLCLFYINLGDTQSAQGKIEKAEESFKYSTSLNEYLVTQLPKDIRLLSSLATSYERMADIRDKRGDFTGYSDFTKKSYELREKIYEHEPDDAENQQDLATMLERMGSLAQRFGDYAEALEKFNQAMAIREKNVSSDPNNNLYLKPLATSYSKLADLALLLSEFDSALNYSFKELYVWEKLSNLHPDNARIQQKLMGAYMGLGDVFFDSEKFDQAQELYYKTLQIIENLTKGYPENKDWQRDLSMTYYRIGDVLRIKKLFHEAESIYNKSFEISKKLLDSDPNNAEYQGSFFAIGQRFYRIAIDNRDYFVAIQYLHELLTILRNMRSMGMVFNTLESEWYDWLISLEKNGTLQNPIRLQNLLENSSSDFPGKLDSHVLSRHSGELIENPQSANPRQNSIPVNEIDQSGLLSMVESCYQKGQWEAADTLYEKLHKLGIDLAQIAEKWVNSILNIRSPLSEQNKHRIVTIIKELRDNRNEEIANRLQSLVDKSTGYCETKKPWWTKF